MLAAAYTAADASADVFYYCGSPVFRAENRTSVLLRLRSFQNPKRFSSHLPPFLWRCASGFDSAKGRVAGVKKRRHASKEGREV